GSTSFSARRPERVCLQAARARYLRRPDTLPRPQQSHDAQDSSHAEDQSRIGNSNDRVHFPRRCNMNSWLHRFAVLTACATFCLIMAGALVTSNDAGLAVSDWPLSYGSLTPPWVGNIRYEHGHRTVAASVGLLMVCLAVWVWRKETRCWVRRLAIAALATVVVQGLLGGMTVLFLLPSPVSIAHACLAQ